MSEKWFWIVEDGELVSYLRTGSCNQCGRCCCQNEIGIQMEAYTGRRTEGKPDYSQWEGWSHHRDQGIDWWWRLDVRDKMGDPCHYQDEKGLCMRWDGDLPAVCRYFPMHPRDIEKFPECGFSFERIEEEGDARDPRHL
jgi:Fe-S-cluster containining protein